MVFFFLFFFFTSSRLRNWDIGGSLTFWNLNSVQSNCRNGVHPSPECFLHFIHYLPVTHQSPRQQTNKIQKQKKRVTSHLKSKIPNWPELIRDENCPVWLGHVLTPSSHFLCALDQVWMLQLRLMVSRIQKYLP